MHSGKKNLESTRRILFELHRQLLTIMKADRERTFGQVLNPGEWFQLLLADPHYAWFRPFNALLADADALSELKQIAELDLAILRHELDHFFFKDNEDATSFNYHYRKLFALNHEVMLTHGRLKDFVAQMPEATAAPNAEEIRKGWHKIGSSKRKLLN